MSADLLAKAHKYHSQLDKELSKNQILCDLQTKTKVPKTYMVAGVASVFFLFIFMNVWGTLLTNLLGFVYPCYASFKAIESKGINDDTQWLTYWVVFGLFNIVDFFSDTLLYWVPFYFTIKSIAIIYLIVPQTRGAETLYAKIIRPFFVANSNIIDSSINKIKTKTQDIVDELIEKKDE